MSDRGVSRTGALALQHRLESVKFLPPPPGENDPKDYGPFTVQAVAIAEIQAPDRNRAICMAVTADDRDLGMPSLWSGAVDQLCSGVDDDVRRLMFISAGNLREEIGQPDYEYHRWNCERGGIEDPAQAWNAVTVGACTEKVFIRDESFRGWRPLAESGDLCPTSRTSLPWPPENQDGWPIKPDVVMEGGNYAENGTERSAVDDLSLLTTVLPPFRTRDGCWKRRETRARQLRLRPGWPQSSGVSIRYCGQRRSVGSWSTRLGGRRRWWSGSRAV